MPKTKRRKSSINKRRRRVLGIAALVLLLAIVLVGLLALQYIFREPDVAEQAETIDVEFYFRNAASGMWEQDIRRIEYGLRTDVIERVLQELVAGPAAAHLEPAIPAGARILGAGLAPGSAVLQINFSAGFVADNVSALDRTFATNSIVWTLTSLPFVEQLRFLVEGEPFIRADGTEFGLRNRENSILGEMDLSPFREVEIPITLYFPNEDMEGLVAEPRIILVNHLTEHIDRYIFEALMAGPESPGLARSMPSMSASAAILNVGRQGDTVIVNFTADFINQLPGGSTAEELMVFSLVNTMTEQPEIRFVEIQIESLRVQPDDARFHMDLSRPIERDEGMILEIRD